VTDDRTALRERFREIGRERIRTLNQDVLALEQGEGDTAVVDRAMREIHTLKGESRMLGLGALNRVAHRTEDLLLHARAAGLLQDGDWLRHVYAGLDLLAELLEAQGDDAPGAGDPRAAAFAAEAESLLEARAATVSPASRPAAAPDAAPQAPAARAPAETASRPQGADTGGSQRVSRAMIDEITRTAGELGVLQAHLRLFAEDATDAQGRVRDAIAALLAQGADVADLAEPAAAMDAVLRSMRDVSFDASIRQHRLQAAVERMRLASVATLFDRFPRTVRDLGHELGKEARLVVEGEHVGADRQVLDLLADPMVHLLRNAVDHGLEPPETREAAGKPRRGTIRLRARQAGRFVEILVEDDGRGIDPTAIAEAAVRKGLLSEADVGRMSEREILEQLFRPAFSTQTAVSDVSGRGVGLDVVQSVVKDLGGSVRVESEVGQGTTFVLRLPASIALVDALVLDVGHSLYAVPSAYVERVLDVEEAAFEPTGDREVVRLEGDERVPALDLAALLGLPPGKREPDRPVSLAVVAEGQRRVALRVPALVGEMALVQEALDPFLKGLRLVTGTAMLDGGRRVVMLNAVQLLELLEESPTVPGPAPAEGPEAADAASRTVLLIEDSDLTRSMLVATLTDAGWRVVEAVNGRLGLEAFRRTPPDAVVTDLEMPRMSGFDLIRTIREDPQRGRTPIVVLTTRGDEDSKRRAAEAGADVYLHKSEFAVEDLLGALDRLIAGREGGTR